MGQGVDRQHASHDGSTRAARLHHLERVDAITRAMGSTLDPEESIRLGLRALLTALEVDRVSLHRLDDPSPSSSRVVMLEAAQGWAASIEGQVVPFGPAGLSMYRRHFEGTSCPRPIRLDMSELLGSEFLQRLGVRAMAGVGLRPQGGHPWMLDVHVCRAGREFTAADEAILLDVGARVSVALDLMHKERALREQEARFRAIAEHAPIGVFMLTEGRFSYANASFAEIVGVELEQVVKSANPAELFPDLPCSDACGHCQRRVSGRGGVQSAHVEHPTRGTREVEVSCVPVDELGVPCIVGTLTDVTEREAQREQMASVAKMTALASLVGGVAHHFNNLLAGILGNVYVLEDSPERETWERESLADMRRSGESAAMLVRQLMTFARKGRASLVERDLVALIEGTIRTLEVALPSSTLIRTELPNDMLYALVDPGAVQEIVLNLIDNARQAQSERPRQLVTIRLRAVEPTPEEAERSPQGWAELSVEDAGVGIRAEDLPHVCEPFFTTRDVGQGTGMGLATVYGSVGQMGGDLCVESELGVGTQVRVRFPLVESTSAHTPADASVLPGKGETILVVDDDDTVRSVLARVLKHLGYEVRVYATAEQAIEAFDADPGSFAALLSDMVMPEMGGCELAAELRRRRPALPVMLMTGYDPDRLDGVAQVPGEAPRVLEKPIRLNQLSRAVAKLLHGKPGS